MASQGSPFDQAGILNLTLACLRSEGTAEAANRLLVRIKDYLDATSGTIAELALSGHPIRVVKRLWTGRSIEPEPLRSLALEWLARKRPIYVPSTRRAGGKGSSYWIVHGHRSKADAASMLLFEVSNPHPDHGLALEVMAPHLTDLLNRLENNSPDSGRCFSVAERAVIAQLITGKSNKEIARALGKSEATVRNQLHGIFLQLRVRRRFDAIRKLTR